MSPENLPKKPFEANQFYETGGPSEINDEVDIGVWAFLAPCRRPEDPKPTDAMLFAEPGQGVRVKVYHVEECRFPGGEGTTILSSLSCTDLFPKLCATHPSPTENRDLSAPGFRPRIPCTPQGP